jgi:hypothetical protein
MSAKGPLWKKKPEADDYKAAQTYLSLICSLGRARELIRQMRKASTRAYIAKDLLRASGLPLLTREEPRVDEDLQKIHKGKPLAPVLLVQGDIARQAVLVVADGYHRICAVCYYDEDAPIPCRLAKR